MNDPTFVSLPYPKGVAGRNAVVGRGTGGGDQFSGTPSLYAQIVILNGDQGFCPPTAVKDLAPNFHARSCPTHVNSHFVNIVQLFGACCGFSPLWKYHIARPRCSASRRLLRRRDLLQNFLCGLFLRVGLADLQHLGHGRLRELLVLLPAFFGELDGRGACFAGDRFIR